MRSSLWGPRRTIQWVSPVSPVYVFWVECNFSQGTFHRQYTRLRKLHQQLVLHKSHLTFVSSCLRNHLIPRGLRIKTFPMVPKVDTLQQTLQNQWTTTLNKTSSALLKHLKGYHRAAIPILEEEVNYLKRRLRNDVTETLQWSNRCEIKKRNN